MQATQANTSNTKFNCFFTDASGNRIEVHDPNDSSILCKPKAYKQQEWEIEYTQHMAKMSKMNSDLDRMYDELAQIKSNQDILKVKLQESSDILNELKARSNPYVEQDSNRATGIDEYDIDEID